MMNLGARGGWILNVFSIDLPMQPLHPSISEWLNLITGALWDGRLLGSEVGKLFFFFPSVKETEQLSRL